jgi:GH18 family chitinase/glycerophosphoryl diester phosphodiesterase
MFRPKRHCNFMRLCLLLVSLIWATVAVPSTAVAQDTTEPPNNAIWTTTAANPNPNGFDTPNIMDALFHPHSDLVLLSAHRGLHALAGFSQAAGVPENSLQSIELAAEAGWEMIELDVKLTSDGVPVLSHDKTWGRQWCGMGRVFVPGFTTPFDPFLTPGSLSDTVFNAFKNPAVTATALSDTRSFSGNTVIRDSVSLLNSFTNHGCNSTNQFFGEYPPTLADALDYITKNHIRMVIFLDIQGIDIAKAAFNVVQARADDLGRPFLNSVVFKMPMTVFPNGTADFTNTFGANFSRVNFIPVINTANVAPKTATITDTEDGGFDVSDFGNFGFGGEDGILTVLQHFETDVLTAGGVTSQIHIPAVEVNYKEPEGILTTVLQRAKSHLETGLPMTVGIFNPVGEYYPNGDTSQIPEFFRSSNGTCCDTLLKFLYNNPDNSGPVDPTQPVDHSDQRLDLNFILNAGFQYIITDNPTTARSQLVQRGLRNICYMQPNQSSNCSSGGFSPTCSPDDPSCVAQGSEDPCTDSLCTAPDPNPCDPNINCIATDPKGPPTQILITPVPPAPSRRVAYYNSWSIYANAFYPKALDTQGIAGKLTTLNYSFENIDPVNLTCFAANKAGSSDESDTTGNDGASDAWADYQMGYTSDISVDGSTDAWEQPLKGNFNQLKELKAKYPNLKVLLTLGGWTYSKFFSDVAATDASRKKFVSSCIDLYIKGNLPVLNDGSPAGGSGAAAGVFDGFDIDWEYPGSNNGHAGNHFGPQDTANYTALLAEFRSELDALGGKHYLITAAVPAGPTEIQLLQIPQINQYLDYADIMTYDFHGAFEVNGPTNFQAPLFETTLDPSFGTGFTVDSAVNSWINGGFPANKLNLGVAFYGRGWTGVPDNGAHGLYQSVNGATAPFPFSQAPGEAFYKELESAGVLANHTYFDETSGSAWVYDGTNFYGLEVPYSLQYKLAYINKMGLGGVMMFSLEDDDSSSSLFNAATGPTN